MIHVYPLNDSQVHRTDGVLCACKPRLEVRDPVTGKGLVVPRMIHHWFGSGEAGAGREEGRSGTRGSLSLHVGETGLDMGAHTGGND